MAIPRFQSPEDVLNWEATDRLDARKADLERDKARKLKEAAEGKIQDADEQIRAIDELIRVIDEERESIGKLISLGLYREYRKDIPAINDLIEACNLQVTNELVDNVPTDASAIRLSEDVIDSLRECEDADTDLITAILFIFGFSGGNIELGKIKHLDENKAKDWHTIEQLKTFLNDKIEDAIGFIDSRLGNLKNIFVRKRIAQIKQAIKDFEPMRELVPPLAA